MCNLLRNKNWDSYVHKWLIEIIEIAAVTSTAQTFGVSLPFTSTLPAETSSLTPISTNTSSQSFSSPPVGAIVGGVIGGLATATLLATTVWFLIKRKRNNAAELRGTPHLAHERAADGETKHFAEAEGHTVHEIGVHGSTMIVELPSHRTPVELDGVDR